MTPSVLLLFFAKYPVPGRVKTRLGQEVGMEEAAHFYRIAAAELNTRLSALNIRRVCCGDPFSPEKSYREWLGPGLRFWPQEGADLGERMENALSRAVNREKTPTLLMGSDIPDLPLSHVRIAAGAISRGNAVIGPACDGGFYLIGLPRHAPCQNLFSFVEWREGKEYEQTIKSLKHVGMTVERAPIWQDIDTVEDLAAFAGRAHPPLTQSAQTAWDILSRLPMRTEAPTTTKNEES